MISTKLKAAAGLTILAVTLLGLGLGRMTVGTAGAAGHGDKTHPLVGAAAPAEAVPTAQEIGARADAPLAQADPGAPGADLVVRRPTGSYTREVPGYGKATLTFTESRLHVVANIRIEKVSFSVTADADYSMNRESMVYGIITGVDVTAPVDADEAAEFAVIVGAASDTPFAFRVRADEDSITIKNIKFGPIGSPLFAELLGGKDGEKEQIYLTSIIGGKFKADPHPELAPPTPQKAVPGGTSPKTKRHSQTPPPGPLPRTSPVPGPLPRAAN